jgi:hypothetical protein
MGQPARILDRKRDAKLTLALQSEPPADGVAEDVASPGEASAVCVKAAAACGSSAAGPGEPDERLPYSPTARSHDEPTQPLRARLGAPPGVRPAGRTKAVDRSTVCALARLAALREWIVGDDADSHVGSLVGSFLVRIGTLNQSLDALLRATQSSSSGGLRAAAEGFAAAVQTWRTNVVGQVDELALVHRDSLVGWSSLPEYSTGYVLAVILPPLQALRDCLALGNGEGVRVQRHLRRVEGAVTEIELLLRLCTPAR